MAQFTKMVKVELTTGAAPVVQLGRIFYSDVQAQRIGVIVTLEGQAVSLSGTCSGTSILNDGSTVPLTGTVSGNEAYVDLTSSCYAVEGPIQIFLKLTTGSVVTTLLAAVGTVSLTETGTVIDPGTVIPSVSALIASIENAVDSIPADYSALLATIAPTFSTSTAYSAGTYAWYSGTLYRFTSDHAAGSWTGSDAVAVVIGTELTSLKSALDGAEVDISSLFTFQSSCRIQYNDGTFDGGASFSSTKANKNFVSVEGYQFLEITQFPTYSGSTINGLAFYTAAGAAYYVSGVSFRNTGEYSVETRTIPIPPTAKYVRLTIWNSATSFTCKKIIIGTNERVDALETDVSGLTDDVTALDASVDVLSGTVKDGMASATLSGWQSGLFNAKNGENYEYDSAIRNQKKVGITTGVAKIACDDGYRFTLYAWDANGNYIGVLKTGNTFVPESGTLWATEYDCSIHADYLYKVALRLDPASSSITTEDGAHCYFHSYTDDTLTQTGKAADAKATGDALTALENAVYTDETVALDVLRTIHFNISPTTNKWAQDSAYLSYILMIPDTAVRVTIRANASNATYYALLKTATRVNGGTPDYISGETGRLTINAGESLTIPIPSDAHFIWITHTIQNVDRKPQSVVYRVNSATEHNISVFTGKKLAACGHSGTQGTHLSNRMNAWPYVVGRRLNMSDVQNVAIGGSIIAKQEGSYEEIFFSMDDFNAAEKDTSKLYLVKDDPTDWHPYMLYQYTDDAWGPKYNTHTAEHGARSPIVDVAKSIDEDADVIIVGAGANDWKYALTPFGTMEDRGENATPYTFYGALHMLLKYFMDTYKSKGIPVFFTDAVIRRTSNTFVPNSLGKTYWDYKNAIIEVCEYYGYPFIDCGFNTGIPFYSIDPTWYADEGIHLSAKGHERVGMFIAGKLAYYMV